MCFHENFGCFFGPTAPLLSSRVLLVWLEVSLFVSESGFSFLEWRVHRRCAMGTHVKQCSIEQDRMFLLLVSPHFMAVPPFWIQVPWAVAVPKPTPNM